MTLCEKNTGSEIVSYHLRQWLLLKGSVKLYTYCNSCIRLCVSMHNW